MSDSKTGHKIEADARESISANPGARNDDESITLALGMWTKLARAFSTFNRLVVDDIRNYGLTMPQFGVIEAIAHLGPLSLGELSRKQLSSGGNMTVVVDNLEGMGLVVRKRSEEDRRTSYVHLSDSGRALFESSFPVHARVVRELAAVLDAEEQRTLSRLLKKLGLSLSSDERQGGIAKFSREADKSGIPTGDPERRKK